MIYIISILIIAALILFYLRYSSKIAHQKGIEEIREAWGHPKKETFYFGHIEKYAALIKKEGFHELSEQTIRDVDFYGLFSFIDRTSSKVGQQYLYEKVLRPSNNVSVLHKLNDSANFFAGNSTLREAIQHELLKLNNNNAYYISSLLEGRLLKRPKWLDLLIINVLTVVVLLALSAVYPVLLIVLIIPVTINMFIHYWNKNNAFQFVNSFPQLNLLVNVSKTIANKNSLFTNTLVQESISSLRPFQQKLGLISLTPDGGIKTELGQLSSYFIELLKAFFLIEVFALFQLVKELETKKESILNLFKFVGEIDTAISIASLRAGSLKTCQPNFIHIAKSFLARNMHHPLIENCVKNDITVLSKSILITGSNMSGKTTFLRTLIINSILAQSIYTCFADEFKTPMLKQFSSIRIDDNLLDGKSFYYEEVNVMASLINQIETSDQNIFVLDEVFKGTNTIERIAAAKAILSYLNRDHNIVVVSTHDIELSKMLENEYDLYHFVETIENKELQFDHKIKPGHLKTRNAIRILEIFNYPTEIINEAKELSGRLEE